MAPRVIVPLKFGEVRGSAKAGPRAYIDHCGDIVPRPHVGVSRKLRGALYDYSHAWRIGDIFPQAFIDRLNIRHLRQGKRAEHRGKFVRGIFLSFLNIVLDDCILHQTKFAAPVFPQTLIYIRDKPPREMTRILRHKRVYRDVNLMLTRGRVYEFCYASRIFKGRKKVLPIRIAKKKYKMLVRAANSGLTYFPE